MTNLKLNKVKNIELLHGDVNEVIPELNEKFDRILMPLPKNAGDFLDLAFKVCKKGTTIHLYQFLNEKEFEKGKKKIKELIKEKGINIRIVNLVKCGQHAPHVFRVCFDLKIIKL